MKAKKMMFKKMQILTLILSALLCDHSLEAKLSPAKKYLLQASAFLTAGYAACKLAQYYPYWETNRTFDERTSKLLQQIQNKYGACIALLTDFDYQPDTTRQQVNTQLIKLIDKQAPHPDLACFQAELELRLGRLNSWRSNADLYDKWYDQLLAATAGLYDLERWLTN